MLAGLISVSSGALVAVIGYLFGGARERGIDRRRQNYQLKLEEFRKVNGVLDVFAAVYFILPKYEGACASECEPTASAQNYVRRNQGHIISVHLTNPIEEVSDHDGIIDCPL